MRKQRALLALINSTGSEIKSTLNIRLTPNGYFNKKGGSDIAFIETVKMSEEKAVAIVAERDGMVHLVGMTLGEGQLYYIENLDIVPDNLEGDARVIHCMVRWIEEEEFVLCGEGWMNKITICI